jgi:acyl-CoA synthetase (NDP forming)/ribosomal protein S18 acetylase RimI-like enzyme
VEALTTQGRIVRIRPVLETDAAALRALNRRTSDRSLYFRFFNLNRHVADRQVAALVRPPDPDHQALVALFGDEVAAVAGYERLSRTEAEVALLVEDAHQGEGLGTLLLEHLAALARSRGIEQLVGDVLTRNRQMARVFTDLGLPVTCTVEDGVAQYRASTTPDEAALAVFDEREARTEHASLEPLLAPRSVAVVGAGRRRGVGRQVLAAILEAEFAGAVYAVNPHARSVAGVRSFPTVTDVPRPVDLAVIAVPAPALPGVVTDCAQAGVRAAVILTSGLGELDDEGKRLQERLLRIARGAGMRLVGPNCLGVVNTDPEISLEAWFAPTSPEPGHLALAAQSGAVAMACVDAANRAGLGIANVVSLGNKADVSGNDLLLRWWRDDRVRVIALYLESLGNPRKFARLSRRVAATKPIVVVKAARSAAGRRAGLSHTAAAASSDVAVDALFAQAGVLRCTTVEEMIDAARAFESMRIPAGGRVGVLGNAGGLCVLAADAAPAAGLSVPSLSPEVRRLLPGPGAPDNPLDLGAGATAADLKRSIAVLADSGEVDALVGVVAATRVNAPHDLLAALTESPIPAVAVAVGQAFEPVLIGSHGQRVPVFLFPEAAVRALGQVVHYGRWRRSSRGTIPEPPGIRESDATALVNEALDAKPQGGWLGAELTAGLLSAYGVPVATLHVARSRTGAVRAGSALGYPVALKTADPHVVHKSDVAGVMTDLTSGRAVAEAYLRITAAHPGHPALVQPMIDGEVELLVGAVQDPSFGPVLMLAMGGVWSDLLDDRTFRLIPITLPEATAMVNDLRCAPLLSGYRGAQPCDIDAVEDVLIRVSRLVADHPEIAELDLNPVRVSAHGAVTVDAKVRLAVSSSGPMAPLRCL